MESLAFAVLLIIAFAVVLGLSALTLAVVAFLKGRLRRSATLATAVAASVSATYLLRFGWRPAVLPSLLTLAALAFLAAAYRRK